MPREAPTIMLLQCIMDQILKKLTNKIDKSDLNYLGKNSEKCISFSVSMDKMQKT